MKLGNQRIISLKAENVKRLTVVDITTGEGNVVITGENKAGKSSVLDALEMTLRGADAMLDKPIRDGKKNARVVLQTTDLIVTRRFTQTGTYLEVTNSDGLKYPSPQELLRGLINLVGFDPRGFCAEDPKAQAKRLIKIAKPDLDVDKINGEINVLEIERRDINRDGKALLARVNGILPPDKDLPTVEVSISALTEEMSRLQDRALKIQTQENVLSTAGQAVALIDDKISDFQRQITEYQKLREQKVAAKDAAEAELKSLKADGDPRQQYEVARGKIGEAQQTNSKIQTARQRATLEKEFGEKEAKAKELTAKIESKRLEISSALNGAKFPVPGLTIDDLGNLLYQNIPLNQCATSEQIHVGIAIAAVANPKFKVAFIRDGSLLDGKTMKLVEECAKEYGLQVWIERVEDSSPTAIQIVDGSNVGVKDAGEDLKPEDAKPAEGETAPAAAAAPEKPKGKRGAGKGPALNDLFPKA